jgi:ribosomal subunit interface protein
VDILFKGRHTSVQERFREHATMKLAKLEKLDQKVMRIDVEVSKERNPRQNGRSERVELTIRSRGPAIRAEAAADDRFSALDLALAKLESRLRRACDRRKPKHGAARAAGSADGQAAQPRQPDAAQAAQSAAEDVPVQAGFWPDAARSTSPDAASSGSRENVDVTGDIPIEMEGDGPLVVRQKIHSASPMTIDQALFEMELVGHDFYLFHDKESGCSSVVYRRCGYQYGVIRLMEEHVPQQTGQFVIS